MAGEKFKLVSGLHFHLAQGLSLDVEKSRAFSGGQFQERCGTSKGEVP